MRKIIDKDSAFFSLLRGGLWGDEVVLTWSGSLNFPYIYQLAQEQSVVGLVAAGIERVVDNKFPKEDVLQIVGQTLQLEQNNTAMNYFIGCLFDDLRKRGIKTLLVKGQGIAQCYNKPLWRASGDVDLFMEEGDYFKAKSYLSSIAQSVGEENPASLHLAIQINPWTVELHGTLRSGLGKRIDRVIDEVQEDTFKDARVRVWKNGNSEVLLPEPNNDVVFVFTHILGHFFMGGIGLRQVCDWCRLLWTYKKEIDVRLLETRLMKMGIMSEWKSFAALAVNTLGMPDEAMPLYSPSKKWVRKSNRILTLILEFGNFGHNRDNSYYQRYPFIVYKTISLLKNTWDSIRHFMIFPKDANRVWFIRLREGIKEVVKKK